MAATRKVGKRKSGKRKPPSWEAQELGDINRYWKRPWFSSEGKRQLAKKAT